MTLLRKAIRDSFVAALRAGSPTAAADRVHKERILPIRPDDQPALSVTMRDGTARRFDGAEASLRLRHDLEVAVELYVRDAEGKIMVDLVEDLGEQVRRVLDPLLHGVSPLPSIPELELMPDGCHFSRIQIEFDDAGRYLEAGALLVYALAYVEPVRGAEVALDQLQSLGVGYDFPPPDGTLEASDDLSLDEA